MDAIFSGWCLAGDYGEGTRLLQVGKRDFDLLGREVKRLCVYVCEREKEYVCMFLSLIGVIITVSHMSFQVFIHSLLIGRSDEV